MLLMVATSNINPGSADNGTVGACGAGPGSTGAADVAGAGISVELSSGLLAALIIRPAPTMATTTAAPMAIRAQVGRRRGRSGANEGR
ncbi:hypothetical protein A5773_05500 [Mycobacterium sp. 852014-52450_SCH5900713]|nr:hypothetical protein A5773_05500 [Mycobacterium sp. 852014-52450_SCH5900713]